jgi:hypothetical protein
MKFISNYRRTQVLPPRNYVYYTWLDPLKPRQLVISCGSKKTQLELTVRRFHFFAMIMKIRVFITVKSLL